VLRAGGVALLPAEGVYGLHALASSEEGLAKLLALKPREETKRFIGLIGDPRDASRYALIGDRAAELIARHWPGALTLVLPAAPGVPASMRHPDGTVALRCPGNEFLRRTVQLAGSIVVSTSANRPGEPPMTRALGPLGEAVDLVVDQGELPGTASTIVAVERESVRVLREGAVRIQG
jgi:L-threonylcarbamoyladenylate synthase